MHGKNSLLQHKFFKNLYLFNRHELGPPTQECDVKSYSTGLPESESDKKFDFDS